MQQSKLLSTPYHKEKNYFSIMLMISMLIYIPLLIVAVVRPSTISIFLWYALFFMIFRFVISTLMIGYIKGNGVKLNPLQFPEVYGIAKSHSEKLGMPTIPEIYVIQGGGMLNAFATRFARRNFVVIYADILESAYNEGIDVVSFILGHELGHIKRKHVSVLKHLATLPARLLPFIGNAYSRACEYTCDQIGYALCPEGAQRGLLLLAAGKHLYKRVNVDTMMKYQMNHLGYSAWLTEIFSSHPMTIKRLARIAYLKENNSQKDKLTYQAAHQTAPQNQQQL
jgi:Zn-dependent protease with chaperone function